MLKQTALAALLGACIVAPAAAQSQDVGTPPPGTIAQSRALARQHVRQGERAGQITPDELSHLRADAQALRSKLRALRQSGAPLSRDQRQSLRRELRGLHREIFAARHHGVRRHR